MREKANLTAVSDDELLRRLSELLGSSRRVEADLVAHIAEVDARKLYAREAAPSMFAYCTGRLRLSEQEAYLRINVGRASREHPMLLGMLRDGRLHLSGLARLVPHLTLENREEILARAVGKSHRQIVELVAELAPRSEVPTSIRKLPARKLRTPPAAVSASGAARVESPVAEHRTGGGLCAHRVGGLDGERDPTDVDASPRPAATSAPGPSRRPRVEPLAPSLYKVQFSASEELREKLERLQALMRSSVPDGDLGKVIDLAVTRELERLEGKRFAKARKPRKSLAETDTTARSRHIPAAVKRAVHERDGGRCTYRDKHGRRCTKRHDLEFHHRRPFARGGDHSPEVLCLVCRTHNQFIAEQDYGREVMGRYRRSAKGVSETVVAYSTELPQRPRRTSPG